MTYVINDLLKEKGRLFEIVNDYIGIRCNQ